MEQTDVNKIKEAAEEFFEKMTIPASGVEAVITTEEDNVQTVDLNVRLSEPQILIGQGGQTLFEIQRLLRTILNKKLQAVFYLNLDINDYKKQKLGYLKDLAKSAADQVSLTKEQKELPTMSAYERRIVHAELSQRTDVITKSSGEGSARHIIILPK